MSDDKPEYFTIVFDGRLRDLNKNPFQMESPFGKVVAVGVGDALGRQETVIELTELAIKGRALADHCVAEGMDDIEIEGFEGNVADLSADFSCGINRAQGA